MKRNILLISILCSIFCVLVGCKKDKEKEPETFMSNVSRPTWKVMDNYDMSSSMTAVVRVDLRGQYPEKASDFQLNNQDILAAFSGEEYLGIASPQNGLFFLYIVSPSANKSSSDSESFILRYYSSYYKNLFVAQDTLVFSNDSQVGTISKPFVPAMIVKE